MIDLPFRLASDDVPLLLVTARVAGGRPLDLVLDTGNGSPFLVLLPPSVVGPLGLPLTVPADAVPRVQLRPFELGAFVADSLEAAVVPELEVIFERAKIAPAGNLGAAFLRPWTVRIDYDRCRVRLDDERLPSDDAGIPFTTGTAQEFILFPAVVNGQGPYRFLLDTGASATVLAPPVASHLGLRGPPVEGVGMMGDLTAETVQLTSLEACGHTRADEPAVILDIFGATSQAAGVPIDGILGYSFLRHYTVEVDYPGRRVRLLAPAG